jgi:hypothetical protein
LSLTYVSVTGTFEDGSGAPITGTVTFTPSQAVYAAGVPVIQPSVPVQAEIVSGQLKNLAGATLTLLATENAGLTVESQTGFWYWTVTVTIAGKAQPSWSFFLPSSPSSVDLYALANTPAGGFSNPMTAAGDLIDGGSGGTPQRLAIGSSGQVLTVSGGAPAWLSPSPALPLTTLGDTVYENGTPAPARLPGNTSATKQFLTQTGTGSVSAAPAWAGIVAADLPAATSGAAGAVQLAGDLGNTAAAPEVLSTHLSAPLPLAQGGTGQASQQAAMDALAGAVTSGDYLRGNGSHVTLSAIQAGDLPSNGGIPLGWMPAVVITTTGSSFSPSVALAAGSTATVSWVYNGSVVATGLTPTISFGSSGTRTVRMYATDSSGFNALGQVTVFNIGYASLDTGPWSPSSSYNWAAQPVSNVQNINAMTGLVWFLAQEVTGLTGPLDFSGMTWLTVADMHCLDGSPGALTGVKLDGCTSLQRLGVEACSLSALNLNPVAASLRDLRSAVQTTGTLVLQQPAVPLTGQYHFCIRDNQAAGTSLPRQAPSYNETDLPSHRVDYVADMDTWLPNLSELLVWNTGLSGMLKSSSRYLESVQAYDNWLSGINFQGCFAQGLKSGSCTLDMHQNVLTSVNLTGCAALGDIDLHQNPLSQSQVDGILAAADAFGTSNGTLNLQNTAAPSSTGLTHKTNLTGRGWTVTTDASGAPGGGFGNKFTLGESVISRCKFNGGTSLLVAELALPVNSGDLLVAVIEAGSTPVITDSAGNTWTVTGPYQGDGYLAYCLSSAASASGLAVSCPAGFPVGLAVSRFVPHGTVSFGAAASAGNQGAGGIGQGSYSLGNLGTVPADALAWGAFWSDDQHNQTYSAGYQSGSSGTPDFIGAAWQNGASGLGSGANPQGTMMILYVPGCANANAALTWSGGGTGSLGTGVSAYFTST